MNISELAFHYRKLVFVLLGFLLIVGAQAYFTLPAKEDPTITIREATVTTYYPGMAPRRVEQLITKTLEEQIRKIPEVERIRSTSATGQSIIHVEIADRYFALEDIWQDLRNKVNQAYKDLPEGTQEPIINDEFGDVSVLTLALTADGFSMAEKFDVAKHVRDLLYAVEGTKKVDILGTQQERIFLEASNAKLAQLGLSPNTLIATLQNQNIVRPGGQIDTGKKAFVVEPTGNFDNLDEIGNTLIAIPGSEDVIPLKDIVNLSRDYIDPPRQIAYFNGERAIVIAVAMLEGYNVLEYSPRLKLAITDIENSLPIGYQLNIATEQAVQVERTVSGVSQSVMQTLLIVLVVVVLFLGQRTGLIVGTIVPFVMLVTLAVMQFAGMSLERMSLATLIIALGLLVDNGIVIAEDFKSRLENGDDRYEALKSCGKELALPLLSSTITTVLVFLPLMLAEHVAGEYTRTISLVILITLSSSWLLALCVTPIFCYFFIHISEQEKQKKEHDSNFLHRVKGIYQNFIEWALAKRKTFLVLVGIALLGSMSLMPLVEQQFFPDSDREQVLIFVSLSPAVSTRETNRNMENIFAWIKNNKDLSEIKSFSGYVGFGGPRFVLSLSPEDPADNRGFIVVNIKEGRSVDEVINKLHRGLMSEFPDIFVRVKKMFLGPSDSSELKIQVKGPDKDFIYAKAEQVVDLFHSIDGVIDIRHDWESRIAKVIVDVDQQRARRAGVTSDDIANALQGYFSGVAVTEYRERDDIVPIVLRAEAQERFNLDRMRTISIFSESRGVAIPLFQVADFRPEHQYAKIQREDMFRTVSIEGRHTGMTAEDLKRIVDPKLEQLKSDLPVNYTIEYDGVITESAEAQKALSSNIPMVIGAILVLLVAQFNSYRKPLVIVLTIPLAITGAIMGLLVMNAPFGFMVSLGLYSLAGIIINNAIVLIDRFKIEQDKGVTEYQAIINSCLTRLRPITMTTVTTIMGLLPLIVGKDPLFFGMAVVIAFGLGVGTLLTLGVVPVLYAVFYGVRNDAKQT